KKMQPCTLRKSPRLNRFILIVMAFRRSKGTDSFMPPPTPDIF
ncbi:MAG: hypothetical protein ACI9RO_002245, partial [Alteromonas macleodii]